MTKDNRNIKIESMLRKHQEFLWKMLYQALFVPKGDKPFPQEIIHHPDISKYAKNWGNGNDIGLIAIDVQTNEKVGAAWLSLFTKKYNAISLSVEVANNPAMKLYKRVGFKRSARIFDSLTMIKVIKKA